MRTLNLCFGSKIRKIVYPCKPQFYYIKVGYEEVYISRTCHPDVTTGTGIIIINSKIPWKEVAAFS